MRNHDERVSQTRKMMLIRENRMSLHTPLVRNNFANEMRTLWSYWDTTDNILNLGFPGTLMSNVLKRQTLILQAIARVVTFMPVPTVTFTNKLPAHVHGQFRHPQWEILINENSLNYVGYGTFMALVSTIYRALRHAEQFFRIAQGLACNQLSFPRLSQDQSDQCGFDTQQSAQQMSDSVMLQPALTAQQIATLICIPNSVAKAATRNAEALFQGFIDTARPEWFKAATVLDEVKDWMNTTFDDSDTQAALKKNPNGDDVARVSTCHANACMIDRSHAMEKDAFGVATYIEPQVQMRIGVDPALLPRFGRMHPAFDHLPS
ncbi:hypothetical protein ACJ5NV_01525 [Loktanella agnita]|uniref:hypothetical protein n=1 Tax=Loktanella agnita TaxID=287097 RepID=UPI0039881D76